MAAFRKEDPQARLDRILASKISGYALGNLKILSCRDYLEAGHLTVGAEELAFYKYTLNKSLTRLGQSHELSD